MRRKLLLSILAVLILPCGFAEAGGSAPHLYPVQNEEGTAPADFHTRRYVDTLLIEFKPTYKVPLGGPVDAKKLSQLSNLTGVELKYDRDHTSFHTFLLPHKLAEPEAEALCKKLVVDPDVKSCGPDYMVFGQGTVRHQ